MYRTINCFNTEIISRGAHPTGISEKAIISITKPNGSVSIHSVVFSSKVQLDCVGLSLVDRQWLEVPLDDQVLRTFSNSLEKLDYLLN